MLDRETRRFVELMSGRVINGSALLQAIKEDALIDVGGLAAEQKANAVAALEQWRAELCYQPSGTSAAWQPEGLRYQLQLNTGLSQGASRTPLIARECRNGEIDWHSFSAPANQENDLGDFDQAEAIKVRPTHIRVRGTSPRWWEFEDASLDLGNLDTARPDLAKLLLMEFVLVYGDDWFSVPLPVKCGNLVRIDALKVRTTFGEEFDIKSANRNADIDPLKRWEIFSIDRDRQPSSPGLPDVLLLPPPSGVRQESKPLEEIRFLRDEGANMVWAVENTVLNGLGRRSDGWAAHFERKEREREAETTRIRAKLDPLEEQLKAVREALTVDGLADTGRAALEVSRGELVDQIAPIRSKLDLLERKGAGGTPSIADVPRYRLATTVPEHWIPFIPAREPRLPGENKNAFKSVGLQRAQMLRNTEDEKPVLIDATSRLLGFDEGDPIIWLDEATVPRSGLKLQLTAQRTRGADGKTYVWLGRKVNAGRGEGSSGLRFDVLSKDAQ